MMNSTFEMAKTGFEISLGLTGVMTLWMGLMRVGEKGGIVYPDVQGGQVRFSDVCFPKSRKTTRPPVRS